MVDLLVDLPAVAHKNRLDLPLYGAEIDEAYKRDPASLEAAIPLLAKDLFDKEPGAQFESVVLIQALAMESNNPKFVLQFADQLSQLMISSDEYTRGATMSAAAILGEAAPENIVQSLLATLKDKASSGRLLTGAVGALLVTRPNDTHVEDAVLLAVNDTSRPKDLQCQMLYSTGAAGRVVGQPIVDNIISVATNSHDVNLRDAAIGAAERVGLRALGPLTPKLSLVAEDPNESPASRAAAAHALKIQAHSVR